MRISIKTVSLLSIVFIASLMRIGHFMSIHNDPIADVMFLDCLAYDSQALKWADGQSPFDSPFFQAPLYPFLLSRLYKILGHNYDFVRIVQMMIDILTTFLVWRIALKVWGLSCAWIAGLIVALYPVLIFESGLILKTTLSVFLFAATLWTIYVFPNRYRILQSLLSAVFAGLSAINQGSFLLLIPLYFVWILTNRELDPFPKRVIRCAVFCLGVAVTIAPITIHNWNMSGEFILLTTQGGANFYLGNSPYSDGTSKRPPNVRMTTDHEESDFHREAQRALGKELTPKQASAYWGNEAWRWIRENPADAIKLQFRKFGLFWNRVEIPDNFDFDFYRRYSYWIAFPRFPFFFLCLAGIPGIYLAIRNFRADWLLVGLTLGYCLIVTSFHVYSRYRLPVIVPLSILAGYGIASLCKAAQTRQLKTMRQLLFISVLSGILLYLPLTHYSHAQPLFNLGVGLMRLSQFDDAVEAFNAALAINPNYSDALGNLGKIAYQRNEMNDAERFWLEAITLDPESEEILSNLGTLAVRNGDLEMAEHYFRRSVQSQPYYFLGWLHLAQLLQMRQKTEESINAIETAISLEPAHPQGLYMYADILDHANDPRAKAQWTAYLRIARAIMSEAHYVRIAEARLKQFSASIETID